MAIGIYKLSFKGTDRVYIGQSINTSNRKLSHKNSFLNKTASKKLQAAYDIYGEPYFEVLEECKEEDLSIRELYYINKYNSVENGFNTVLYPNAGNGLSGEECYNSTYSNKEYVDIMLFIIKNKHLSSLDIATELNISINIVIQLLSGNSQKWLNIEFPKEYQELMSIKGNRYEFKIEPKSTSKLEKEEVYEVLKLLITNPKIKHKDIHKVTGVNINTIRDISSGRRHRWLKNAYPNEYNQLLNLKTKEI